MISETSNEFVQMAIQNLFDDSNSRSHPSIGCGYSGEEIFDILNFDNYNLSQNFFDD
jgi:hypothetical protein